MFKSFLISKVIKNVRDSENYFKRNCHAWIGEKCWLDKDGLFAHLSGMIKKWRIDIFSIPGFFLASKRGMDEERLAVWVYFHNTHVKAQYILAYGPSVLYQIALSSSHYDHVYGVYVFLLTLLLYVSQLYQCGWSMWSTF